MTNTKASKKRKRNAQNNVPAPKIQKVSGSAPLSPDPSLPSSAEETIAPKNLQTLISDEEMELTVDTLLTLAKYPAIIKSKPCKNLRAAVYDFKQACTTGANASADTSLTARISGALTDGKYTDALILLAEMRIRGEAPKLGALCRWVRDLDVVSGVCVQDNSSEVSVSRTTNDLKRMKVLDAVLRVTGPLDTHSSSFSTSNPIVQQKLWNLRDEGTKRLHVRESVLDRSIFASQKQSYADKFQNIEETPGPQRKPPNHHPAIVYLTSDNTVPLSDTKPSTTHNKHPHVPNLSLLKNVLSTEECRSIIAATETIGFLPDAPIKDDGSESSILAHNVYWMIDQAFHDKLWERVQPFIPEVAGKKALSINRRFRVYRYVPGAEYRCHIDGAWPPSGIHPVTKAYQYDSSPANAKQSSLFTFLIYLNDEFEGGETTFFIPSVVEGVMNAYPVNPVMGSVAMFPHGETKGALLHEGTGVRKGAKYVIRTDVEYAL
ncbi:hypothetical protein BT63DRAFT_421208 [Microthyrium microscopicum]|uniref:Fe2OG dioxygenase domain-containing protein n=1 Tax=Microthyrium microscopicum TaxID=703497 RepID=A0A6A6UNK0_9PEZI|nr:hypothetical protein BT63DRAFT_421208 [Microthyrium microscopicum]